MTFTNESRAFVTFDDSVISLEKAVEYLRKSGELDAVVQVLLQQFVLERELQQRDDLRLSEDTIEDAIIDWRLQNGLDSRSDFDAWLTAEGFDRGSFRQQIRRSLQMEKLKEEICEAELQEYFIQQKIYLDQVSLSRIVVEDQDFAEELKYQILEDGVSFEKLARQHSVLEESVCNGMMGLVSRGSLPDELRALIDAAAPGEILGPIKNDTLWYLIRVEESIPASLNDELKQTLGEQLFERWLIARMKTVNVSLHM